MNAAAVACLSALCFGAALVSAKLGLRSLDARTGAAISIPTATALFVLAAPMALDVAGFLLPAALIFALVGVFFPAVVTLLTFASNERLGPSLTSSISSTAPLFAIGAAALLLGESIPARTLAAAIGVVAGITLMSWRAGPARPGWALALPAGGAALRGIAQVLAKAGLMLWPNPFAAGLIGYIVSSGTVLAASRLSGNNRSSKTKKTATFWFLATGVLNGAAVLLMYAALSSAPVSRVAPIVAAYPLVTVLLGALVLHEERFSARVAAGAALTAAAIAYLVAGT